MARTTSSRSHVARSTAATPLRISVVGASVTYMCEPFSDGERRGPYPLQLREEVTRRGIPVELNQWNRWYGMVTHTWEVYERVRDSNPDVIILNFGLAECEPRFIPNRIIAHLLGWRRSTAAVSVIWSLRAREKSAKVPAMSRRCRALSWAASTAVGGVSRVGNMEAFFGALLTWEKAAAAAQSRRTRVMGARRVSGGRRARFRGLVRTRWQRARGAKF